MFVSPVTHTIIALNVFWARVSAQVLAWTANLASILMGQ